MAWLNPLSLNPIDIATSPVNIYRPTGSRRHPSEYRQSIKRIHKKITLQNLKTKKIRTITLGRDYDWNYSKYNKIGQITKSNAFRFFPFKTDKVKVLKIKKIIKTVEY